MALATFYNLISLFYFIVNSIWQESICPLTAFGYYLPTSSCSRNQEIFVPNAHTVVHNSQWEKHRVLSGYREQIIYQITIAISISRMSEKRIDHF